MKTRWKWGLGFVFLFLYCNTTTGQVFQFSKSNFRYNLGSVSAQKIIGNDSAHFFALKTLNHRFILEKLDKDMNLVKEQNIILNKGFKTYNLEKVVHFHHKIFLFSSHKGLKSNTLFYQEIDKNTLLPKTGPIIVLEVKNIKGNWAEFSFALSDKHSRLMVFSSINMLWANTMYNDIIVFDKNLAVLWQRQEIRKYQGNWLQNPYYLVDEAGNVSIIGLIKREKISDVFKTIKNVYSINRYTNNGKAYVEYPITINDKYIRGIRIVANDRGDLICAGLFSELFREGVKGAFYFKIDAKSGMIVNNFAHTFKNYLWDKMEKLNEPVIAEDEFIRYTVSDLLLRHNGDVLLIAEQIFDQHYDTYNNLILVCFDENGELRWNQVIDKKQDFNTATLEKYNIETEHLREYIVGSGLISSFTNNYCSYALMAPWEQNEIMLFFNENIKNLDKENTRRRNFNNPKRSFIRAVQVDEFGNITEYALQKWQKRMLYPMPMRYYDNQVDAVIIPAFKGRKYQYYKLERNFEADNLSVN